MLELNTIHHMSAEAMLNQIETASLIIADPPYGIGYTASTKKAIPRKGGKAQPRTSPTSFGNDNYDSSWLPAAYKALDQHGAMYLFTRWDVLHLWMADIKAAGFRIVQRIVWDKALWGAGDLRYYGSQTEDILFCVKGNHKLRWCKREGNVWRIGRGRVMGKDGGGRHPTQKPVDIFTRIIAYSSPDSGLVVDPFAGSGAALIAAQRIRRSFIGCDHNAEFVKSANKWLLAERQQHPELNTIPLAL